MRRSALQHAVAETSESGTTKLFNGAVYAEGGTNVCWDEVTVTPGPREVENTG